MHQSPTVFEEGETVVMDTKMTEMKPMTPSDSQQNVLNLFTLTFCELPSPVHVYKLPHAHPTEETLKTVSIQEETLRDEDGAVSTEDPLPPSHSTQQANVNC